MTNTAQLRLNLGTRDPKYGARKVNLLRFKLGMKAKVDLNKGETLEFLGFSFRYVKDRMGRSHKYLEMAPSKKSVIKEKSALKEKTSKKYCWMPIPELIKEINVQVEGWAGYFRKGYYRKAMRDINVYLRERLTRHLSRRSQRRYRPPEGVSMYKHLYDLGLKYL